MGGKMISAFPRKCFDLMKTLIRMEKDLKAKINELNHTIEEKEAEATEKYGYKSPENTKVTNRNMYEALQCFNELNRLKDDLIEKLKLHIELRKEANELFRYLLRTVPHLLACQCRYIFHD